MNARSVDVACSGASATAFWIAAYAATLVAFCALDFLWLGVVAKAFYQAEVGPLPAQQGESLEEASVVLVPPRPRRVEQVAAS